MFEWKRLGQVFNPATHSNKPWMAEFAQAPASLIFDDFVRIYFSTRPPRDSSGQYVSYSAFVDVDRSDPRIILDVAERPILSLGSRGSFDEFGIYPVSVIRVGDQIRAYYGGWTRCESTPYNVAIGLAISDDNGVTFSRVGNGPILGYSPSDPMTVSGPKIRYFNGIFYLWYVSGERWIRDQNGRPESIFKIRLATSVDGFRWTPIAKNLVETVLGPDECQASPDVFYLNGKYHMLFSFKHGTDFRGNERGYRLGYASSENLTDWVRDDKFAGLTTDTNSIWDGVSIAYPHFMRLEDRAFLLYLGNDVGRHGFGVAQLQNLNEMLER